MGCSHNFVYTQGCFVCTKCGKRSYGRSYKKKQGKNIVAGISIALVIGIVFFAYTNGIFEISQDNLDRTIQNISQNISKIEEIQKPIAEKTSEITETVNEQIETITKNNEIPKIVSEIPETIQKSNPINKQPDIDVLELEQRIHQITNSQRNNHGLSSLSYDSTISKIARSHSEDMAENNYFSHDDLQGLGPSDRGFVYGYKSCGILDAIALEKQYDRLPKVVHDDAQYRQAMQMYEQLNEYINNGELFGGLSENIFQNNLYDTVWYTNGIITSYEWNTLEELAQSTVNGWMNSPGHRANILGSYHSEGIGVAIADDDKVYITQNFC